MRRALLVYQDTRLRAHRGAANGLDTVRDGRRVRWLDEVLPPLGYLPGEHYCRLRAALTLTLGIDSMVIMKDVCRLDNDEALEVPRWSAITLLRAAQQTAPAGPARPAESSAQNDRFGLHQTTTVPTPRTAPNGGSRAACGDAP